MLCEPYLCCVETNETYVLILVLMEYALREEQQRILKHLSEVLILVLMEYALRETKVRF